MNARWIAGVLLVTMASPASSRAAPVIPDAPPSADVEPLPIDLRWSAPQNCPDRGRVLADVEQLTGRSVSGHDVAIVDGRIDADGAGFVLHITGVPGDATPSRRLRDDDCNVLARAAALMVAVAVAPVQTAGGLELRSQDEDADDPFDEAAPLHVADPTAAPTSASIPDEPTALDRREPQRAGNRDHAEATPPRAARWTHRFLGGLRGGPAIGLVPGPSGAVMGALGWGFGPLRLELVGGHVIRRSAEVDTNAAVRASLSFGGLHLLFAPTVGAVIPVIGAGFEAGVLAGRGTGDRVRSRDVRDAWLAAAGIFGLTWPARGRVALRAQAEALIAVRRPGMHLDVAVGTIPAFRVPSGGLRVMIGAELRLP